MLHSFCCMVRRKSNDNPVYTCINELSEYNTSSFLPPPWTMGFGKPSICIELDKDPHFKYTPATPIKGHVQIRTNRKLKNVSAIVCGLQGKASIVDTLSNKTLTNQLKKIVKEGPFASIVQPLNNYTPNDKTIHSNLIFETDFVFEIPENCHFPSSHHCIFDKTQAIKVWYELYVEIYKIGKPGQPQELYTDCFKFVQIQGTQDPRIGKDLNFTPYTVSNVFTDKLKRFYYNSELNALIPNSMSSNHSKTKFVRKLWNDSYKPAKYSIYTKTIPLSVTFAAPTTFDISKPLYTQLQLCLACDLQSVGIESNTTKDFVFNNQTTGLGLFRIESLKITQNVQRTVKQGELSSTHNESKGIIKLHFENLVCDVKDFNYDKESNTFLYLFDSTLFTTTKDVDLTQPLTRILDEKIVVTNGEIYVVDQNDVNSHTEVPISYSTSTTLQFKWKISDAGSQSREYTFQTNCTPDFLR